MTTVYVGILVLEGTTNIQCLVLFLYFE